MKVRLVHICTSPLFLNFLSGHINTARQHGFEVSVITSPGELLDQFAQHQGVPTYGVPMRRQITPAHDTLALWRIVQILTRIQPHIVHAHTPKAGLLGTTAAWVCRVPVRVYHIRGLPFLSSQGVKRSLLRWSERVACKLAHQVLCVSQSIREIAVQERLCPSDKIKVIASGSGQGVDASTRFNPERISQSQIHALRQQLGIPPDAQNLGYVGRLVRDKGMVELHAAWQNLRERYPRLHLLLVGEFEPQDPVPSAVRKGLAEDPRVHITGWIADTAPYYALMDLLVLPSYREGFPNTPLEAAAMGLPVVATSIPGCVDAVVADVTGTLVQPYDSQALQHAIQTYLDSPELRRAHGFNGRQRVLRDFRQEIVLEAQYHEYVRLLNTAGIPSEGTGPWEQRTSNEPQT